MHDIRNGVGTIISLLKQQRAGQIYACRARAFAHTMCETPRIHTMAHALHALEARYLLSGLFSFGLGE